MYMHLYALEEGVENNRYAFQYFSYAFWPYSSTSWSHFSIFVRFYYACRIIHWSAIARVSFDWTARHGRRTQLLLRWTLFANIFLCKIVIYSLLGWSRSIPPGLLYVYNFSFHFQMLDPGGIANWSVTHVDWSEMKWHPKSYRAQDVTMKLMRNITVWLRSSKAYTVFSSPSFMLPNFNRA